MERLYKEAKGMVDVSRSKAELALRRDGFLIEQVHQITDSFKCEYPHLRRILIRSCP